MKWELMPLLPLEVQFQLVAQLWLSPALVALLLRLLCSQLLLLRLEPELECGLGQSGARAELPDDGLVADQNGVPVALLPLVLILVWIAAELGAVSVRLKALVHEQCHLP